VTEFAELHDDLRAVAREVLGKDAEAATRWRQAADAGWLGLEVPEALDGSGVTFAETAVVLEELGRSTAAVPFLGPAVLGIAAALAVGPGVGRDDLLRGIATGEARVAVALAPHADAPAPEAPFRLDAAGRLTGGAELVVDADVADHLLVLAESDDGPVLVHLPAERIDVRPVLVLDASRSFASVAAEGVAVPDEDVWRFTTDPLAAAAAVLDRAAVAVAADAHGVARAMLEATVAYVGDRRQFDRAIGSFQAVKHQCADALVQLRIGRELLDDAVSAVAAGEDAAPAASRAKSHLGDAAVHVVGTAMQLHGGIGYTWESGIHRSLKRALLDRSLFGAPAAHRARLADHLWP